MHLEDEAFSDTKLNFDSKYIMYPKVAPCPIEVT